MDLSMPVMDGVTATEHIAEQVPDTQVVVLTMHDDVNRTRQALDAGANGYLSKGFIVLRGTWPPSKRLQPARPACPPNSLSPCLRAAQDADPGPDGPLLSDRQIEILAGHRRRRNHQAGGTVFGYCPEDGAQPPQFDIPAAGYAESHARSAERGAPRNHQPRLRLVLMATGTSPRVSLNFFLASKRARMLLPTLTIALSS